VDRDDLTSAEERVAEELGRLVAGPSPEVRARLMTAVRAATTPARAAPRPRLRRRLLWVLASVVTVAGSGVGATSASATAPPRSPLYELRGINEHLRIALSDGAGKEQLRATFASEHINQARAEAAGGDREAARELLRDGQAYIAEAEANISEARPEQQGEIRVEIDNLTDEEQQVGGQVDGQGDAGQRGPGGPSVAQPGGGASGSQDRDGESGSTPAPGGQPGLSGGPQGGGSSPVEGTEPAGGSGT
jgi:hypothetical protein